MIRISLLEFLRTGKLGPVELGMTDTQVRDQLGEPDAESQKRGEEPWIPYICKYGDIELYYNQGEEQLISIHMDPMDVPHGGNRILLDPWILRGSMPIAEVEEALRFAGISFIERPYRAAPNGRLLITDSGVDLGFYLVEERHGLPAGLNFILKSEEFSYRFNAQ